jgi:hypothetical protein
MKKLKIKLLKKALKDAESRQLTSVDIIKINKKNKQVSLKVEEIRVSDVTGMQIVIK